MIPLAPEARVLVVGAALLALAVTLGAGVAWAAPLWLAWLALAFVVRQSSRAIPARPLANVSPVDGRIVEVAECTDPFLSRPALKVRIRQSWLGELNVYCPAEGKVKNRWSARGELPHEHEPCFALWVRTDEHDDVVVVVNLSTGLRYARCAAQAGERLGQGQRCALIGCARVFDLYLPQGSRAEVTPGQPVSAGRDCIASFVHRLPPAEVTLET